VRASLPLPAAGWYALPLDPAGRAEQVAAQVAGAPAEQRPALTATLTALAQHYAGCEQAAVAWRPGEPPHAVIQVSLAPLPHAIALDVLLAQLAADRPGDIGPRVASAVSLPAGDAARVRVLAEGGADPAGRQVVTDVVQYWLPLPDRDIAVVAASSTAVLTDGDDLAALLDTLVRDLTVERPPVE
jgi:hypothetical protein